MKLVIAFLFCIAIISCKEAPKEHNKEAEALEMSINIVDSKYPVALQKIFVAHGGLSNWKNKRTLSFEMPKPNKSEKHTIDLRSRNEKIEMSGISMGSQGIDIWLQDEKEEYKGDPIFYHNLMFYFYAMPFVLADDGINFSDTVDLEFENKMYPGIRISYDDGVGISAKDEYFIHYNPNTFQMEWLGYTVTYRSGEKSEIIKWIRYNDWMDVNGLQLPKSLTWHDFEGRTIKAARNPRNFENVVLSEIAKPTDFFDVPENARIVNKK